MKTCSRKSALVGSMLIGAACLLALGGFWWKRSHQPRYEGKSPSEWFDAFTQTPTRGRLPIDAFRALGTDAQPFLLGLLEKKESRLNAHYFQLYQKLPKTVQRWLQAPVSVADVQVRALACLSSTGTMPERQLRRFAQIIPELENDSVRWRALSLLARHPPDSPEVQAGVLSQLLNERRMGIRLESAIHLATIQPNSLHGLGTLLFGTTNRTELQAMPPMGNYRFGLPPFSTNTFLFPFRMSFDRFELGDTATQRFALEQS